MGAIRANRHRKVPPVIDLPPPLTDCHLKPTASSHFGHVFELDSTLPSLNEVYGTPRLFCGD